MDIITLNSIKICSINIEFWYDLLMFYAAIIIYPTYDIFISITQTFFYSLCRFFLKRITFESSFIYLFPYKTSANG